jgi:hypothetical protein
MKKRIELQQLLEETIGSRNVYFQPPENLEMKYPCVRYKLNDLPVDFANNRVYKMEKRYELTYIDEDPDNEMFETIAQLPCCRMVRSYVYDGLYCYVYNLYY